MRQPASNHLSIACSNYEAYLWHSLFISSFLVWIERRLCIFTSTFSSWSVQTHPEPFTYENSATDFASRKYNCDFFLFLSCRNYSMQISRARIKWMEKKKLKTTKLPMKLCKIRTLRILLLYLKRKNLLQSLTSTQIDLIEFNCVFFFLIVFSFRVESTNLASQLKVKPSVRRVMILHWPRKITRRKKTIREKTRVKRKKSIKHN